MPETPKIIHVLSAFVAGVQSFLSPRVLPQERNHFSYCARGTLT